MPPESIFLSDGTNFRESRARIDLNDEEVLPDGDGAPGQLDVDPVGVAAVVELAAGQRTSRGRLVKLDVLC